jgi:cytochrome c nitrite reductase small subunit
MNLAVALARVSSAGVALPDFHADPVEAWASRIMTWALVVAVVLVAFSAWRVLRGRVGGTVTTGALIASIVLLPVFSVSTGMLLVFVRAERVEFCGSCHRALQPYVDDMKDPDGGGLAAIHFRYQYISDNQCYECHTSYGLFGTVMAKANGIRQVLRYYTGDYQLPLEMWKPYSNRECLKCHALSERWRNMEEHVGPERIQALLADEISCMECHAEGHTAGVVSVGRAQ